jgi:hypothetical protein
MAGITNPARPRMVNLWAKASAATSLCLMVMVRVLHLALALPAPPLDDRSLAVLLLGSAALACLVPDWVCAWLARWMMPADVYGAIAAAGMTTGECLVWQGSEEAVHCPFMCGCLRAACAKRLLATCSAMLCAATLHVCAS